jgi:hypothetical protein
MQYNFGCITRAGNQSMKEEKDGQKDISKLETRCFHHSGSLHDSRIDGHADTDGVLCDRDESRKPGESREK